MPEQLPLIILITQRPEVCEHFASLINPAKFTLQIQPTGTSAIQAVREHRPPIVVVDAMLRGGDAQHCLRVLRRCPDTRVVVPLLAHPADFDSRKLSLLLKLEPMSVIPLPTSRDVLDALLAAALARSQSIREGIDNTQRRGPLHTQRVESNRSLLQRRLKCPFHDHQQAFSRYILRARCIETEQTFFDIPSYVRATRNADYINFNHLAVTVCPVCLFATNNPAYFLDPVEKNHHFDAGTRAAVLNHTQHSRQRVGTPLPSFFNEHRSANEAILATDLAIACSSLIYERNRYTLPMELARLGNLHLRAAQLRQSISIDAQANHAGALDALQKAFPVVEGPLLYKTTYQLIALAIHFSDDRTAFQYMAKMNEFSKTPTASDTDRAAIFRYLPRCQKAWEDRDLHRAAA